MSLCWVRIQHEMVCLVQNTPTVGLEGFGIFYEKCTHARTGTRTHAPTNAHTHTHAHTHAPTQTRPQNSFITGGKGKYIVFHVSLIRTQFTDSRILHNRPSVLIKRKSMQLPVFSLLMLPRQKSSSSLPTPVCPKKGNTFILEH